MGMGHHGSAWVIIISMGKLACMRRVKQAQAQAQAQAQGHRDRDRDRDQRIVSFLEKKVEMQEPSLPGALPPAARGIKLGMV